MSDEAPVPAANAESVLAPVDTSPPSTSPPDSAAEELSLKLSHEQQRALAHLIGGMSIKEAAETAGVSRSTLYRWLEQDDSFAALFNLWKREQFESARVQALALAGAAMKTIGQAIEKGHVPAAIHVAKGLGVLERPRRAETDPELLGRRRVIAEARREAKLVKAERTYEIGLQKRIETIADCDEIIGRWQRIRYGMLEDLMGSWAFYDMTRQGTAEEWSRQGLRKPDHPPDCPRPSEKDLWEMVGWHEREEKDSRINMRARVEKYLAAAPRESAAPPEPDQSAAPAPPVAAAAPTPVARTAMSPRPGDAAPASDDPAPVVKSSPAPVQRVPSRRARKAAAELLADDDEWPWVRIG